MCSINSQVGEKIKNIRQHLGLTQTEFGDLLGWKQSRTSSLETGEANITVCDLARIVSVFGINMNELLPEIELTPEALRLQALLRKQVEMQQEHDSVRNEINGLLGIS